MKVINKRVFYDYEIGERFEAGVNLTGSEVKAVRLGQADLTRSHVRIIGSELYLVNARISPYEYARPEDYQENRTRKLLMHKREIISLKSKIEGANLTIVPISLYTTHNLIKAEIALARGKRKYQKKEAIKRRELKRQVSEEL